MVRPPPSREAQQGWGDRERAPAEAVLDSPVHVLTSRIKEAGSLARLHALSMVTWCHMNSIHVSAFICKVTYAGQARLGWGACPMLMSMLLAWRTLPGCPLLMSMRPLWTR